MYFNFSNEIKMGCIQQPTIINKNNSNYGKENFVFGL